MWSTVCHSGMYSEGVESSEVFRELNSFVLLNMATDFDVEKLRASENYHALEFAIEQLLAYEGWDKCKNEPVNGVTIVFWTKET